jgi:hypothetical protein
LGEGVGEDSLNQPVRKRVRLLALAGLSIGGENELSVVISRAIRRAGAAAAAAADQPEQTQPKPALNILNLVPLYILHPLHISQFLIQPHTIHDKLGGSYVPCPLAMP